MNKKYQVFLSSTFVDLNEERKKVLDLLLMADCIPAGMEAFVATDEEQFNVIKKVIDLCDYYILIIGGRYGSINEHTGVSFTEMEYDYAISKGIPALVFCIDGSIELEESKKETDVIKNGKLEQFKNKAMKNRLASIWKDSSDLVGKVGISIMSAKYEIERPGWIRGGQYDQNSLLMQILELKNENEELQRKLNDLPPLECSTKEDIPFNDYPLTLHFTEQVYLYTEDMIIDKLVVQTTLDALFKHISLRLTGRHKVNEFIDAVSSFKEGYSIDYQEALILKNQFISLNLFKKSFDKKDTEILELTDKGIAIMNALNILK